MLRIFSAYFILLLVLQSRICSLAAGESLASKLDDLNPETTVEILLIDESLTGKIPSLIGNFTALTNLRLQSNLLTGPVPKQVGRLQQMTQLRLDSNLLDGNVPTELGILGQLKVLFLQGNKFAGEIPSELGNLSSVTSLVLKDNFLTGEIPTELGNLGDSLENLELSNNKLSGSIKPELGNLTLLKDLSISDNELIGEIPKELFKAGNLLEDLTLSDNFLNGRIPTQVGFLQSLTGVRLKNNLLIGNIPEEIGNTAGLKTLVLNNNRLTGTIPTQIKKLTQLTFLFLADNKLSGELPIQLSQVPSINSVQLQNNKFDIICGAEFLQWYNPFSADHIKNRYHFSLQCSGQVYPFQLDSNTSSLNSEPAESVQFKDIVPVIAGSRNATLVWSHPDISELDPFSQTKNENDTSFENCDSYTLSSNQVPGTPNGLYEFVGFEITILKRDERGETIVDIRKCVKQNDLQVNNVTFRYTLESLLPATEYELIVRAFNIFRSGTGNKKYDFLFSPSSILIPFKTKDNVPEFAPVDLRSVSAKENEIVLRWDDSKDLVSNGDIIEYEIHSINDGLKYLSDVRQIIITNLQPNTQYAYQVRARTSIGGFSNVFSEIISAHTCPEQMRRESSGECFAIAGSFKFNEDKAVICEVAVPDFVSECETGERLTVQTLNIVEGFWRPNENLYEGIKRCPIPGFCSKERFFFNSSTTVLDEPESLQCSQFHRGVYCSSCDTGFALSNNDGCFECQEGVIAQHEENLKLFTAFVGFLVVFCVFYVWFKGVMNGASVFFSTSYDRICNIPNRIWKLVAVKLRIAEGFLQVLFALQTMLYVDAKQSLLAEILYSMANINLGVVAYVFNVHCAVDVNHYFNLMLYTIPPLSLALILFILYRAGSACRKTWEESLRMECFSMFFIVSFLIYPGASKVIFETFFCEAFETVEQDSEFIFQSALRSDYRLSCSYNANGRVFWITYATFMVLIFPLGIFAIYVYFLYSRAANNALVKDLVYPYKTKRYWFEAYELVRKLMQTSFVSFCLMIGNQAIAASIALNLSAVAVIFLVYMDPYESYTDFVFAVISLLFLVFATQLEFWFDTEECDRECQAEQTGNTLSYLVLAELVALLILSFIDHSYHHNMNNVNAGGIIAVHGNENNHVEEENERLKKEIANLKAELARIEGTFSYRD